MTDGEASKCSFVTSTKIRDVTISFDRSTQYSGVIYLSKANNRAVVDEVAKVFHSLIESAAIELKTGKVSKEKTIAACADCDMTPNLEDPGDIPRVYVTAPFPDVSIIDGATQFITIEISDEHAGLPDPLPDGVSPADILKARDPKGMASCTAAWYRVYITMTMDCSYWLPGSPSTWASCMRKSMDVYANNLRDDCYKNYYY